MRCTVEVIGYLGADPEIRTTTSGRRVASLRVATSEGWKDRETQERRERTTWHSVEVWKQGAVKAIEECLQKGSKVLVTGILRYDDWTDREGGKRTSAKIAVDAPAHQILFLDRRRSDAAGDED